MECLNLKKRTVNSGHSAKKLRRQGLVPGILYGGNRQNFLFEIGEMDLNREILNNGEFGLVNINIDGHDEKALIKEVQKNPVTHEIIHIDLESVDNSKIVNAEVPIKYYNESLLKKNGAIVQKEKGTVMVKCSSENIPKYIEIDLKDRHSRAIRVNDVEFGETIDFLESPETILASITYTKRDESADD